MDRETVQRRIRALRIEIAAIQDSAEQYNRTTAHSAIEKAAHQARLEALNKIQQELASLISRPTSTE